MGKQTSFTALLVVAWLLGMGVIILHPLFLDDSKYELFIAQHQGYIWAIGLYVGLMISIIQIFTIKRQREIEKKDKELLECAKKNQVLELEIQEKTNEIFKKQLIYIDKLDEISAKITRNKEEDNETLRKVYKQQEDIDALVRRIEGLENKIQVILKKLK